MKKLLPAVTVTLTTFPFAVWSPAATSGCGVTRRGEKKKDDNAEVVPPAGRHC